MRGFVVEATGPLATIQDAGRPGYAAVGLSAGGAADRASYRLANRLVGNPDGAAVVEVTLGGFVAVAEIDLVVAVTGASGTVTVNGRPVAPNAPALWAGGSRLVIAPPVAGLRSYLAVSGGIEAAVVLGSRSWHALAQVGPEPLRAGQQVPVGLASSVDLVVDIAPVAALPLDQVSLELTWGPRDDRFTPEALRVLTSTPYDVTPDLDRIGVRLDGASLERSRLDELPSEGMVRGAIQVPASGRPILFLADHPATGGYPVIGVLTPASADLAAQLRPGMTVRVRAAR